MNSKLKIQIYIFLIFLTIYKYRTFKGSLVQWTTPKMNFHQTKEINTSFTEQQKKVSQFSLELCKAYQPCSSAVQNGEPFQIQTACSTSEERLKKIILPQLIPRSIQKNLEIYLQSTINSTKFMRLSWETRISSLKKYFLWEVDTCSEKSIPQQIYKIYQFNRLLQSEQITCDVIINKLDK